MENKYREDNNFVELIKLSTDKKAVGNLFS
jgi:hypothetical protein